MKQLNKYVFYFWRVIDDGFSWTGTSILIATKILFFIISSIILISIYITGLLLSFNSSVFVQNNIDLISVCIGLSSYFIVHKIGIKYRSIDAEDPVHGFPVKGADRLNVLALSICSILLFVVVVVATIR